MVQAETKVKSYLCLMNAFAHSTDRMGSKLSVTFNL